MVSCWFGKSVVGTQPGNADTDRNRTKTDAAPPSAAKDSAKRETLERRTIRGWATSKARAGPRCLRAGRAQPGGAGPPAMPRGAMRSGIAVGMRSCMVLDITPPCSSPPFGTTAMLTFRSIEVFQARFASPPSYWSGATKLRLMSVLPPPEEQPVRCWERLDMTQPSSSSMSSNTDRLLLKTAGRPSG
jgi:hypothetical protein